MLPVTKNSELTGTIKKYMEIRHITTDKLAVAGHMSKRTYQNRMKNPGTFSLEEIRRIFDRLNVPEEERRGYI